MNVINNLLMSIAAAEIGAKLELWFSKAFGERSTRSRHFIVVLVDVDADMVTLASDITDPTRVAFILGKAVAGVDADVDKGIVN